MFRRYMKLSMDKRLNQGFSLVEVLVALLVLSVGLLGVAGMHMKALQSAHIGYQRSVASLAAIDAQERSWKYLSNSASSSCPDTSALSVIQSDWFANWFGDGKAFRDAGSTIDLVSLADCEYEVVVNWDEERVDEVGAFLYKFRLPEIE